MIDLPRTPADGYDQACPIAIGLDEVGERWSLVILRDLSVNELRFSDIIALNPGLSPNLLSKRLKKHVNLGIVERRYLRPPASGYVYSITDSFRQPIAELLQAVATFGLHVNDLRETTQDTPDQVMQYLQSSARLINFRDVDLTGTFSIQIADTTAHVTISDGIVSVAEEPEQAASLTASIVAAVSNSLSFILEVTSDPEQAIEQEALTITGDVEAGLRFVKLFSKSA